MPTTAVYNQQGQQVDELELVEAVFGVKADPQLIQAVVRIQRANAHAPYAHTKNRAEVRGGGRKPWAQKGTGRARQGSIRSPQWRGGGVVFGPRKERNTEKKVNEKERRAAIRMVLSSKASEQRVVVIDSFDGLSGKTKEFAVLLNTLPTQGHSALIASGKKCEPLKRSARNVPRVNTVLADSVNVMDLLKYQYLVVDKPGVETLIKRFTA